ncbi:MAG: N4-gp56 family major capsid protein [Desulfobacterales bacterium]|nr:N4-gp56 family major capsid protein [Desulfobacterales bacterium]
MGDQMYLGASAQGGYFTNPRLSQQLRYALKPLCKFRQFVDIKEAWGKGKGETVYYDKISNISTAGGTLVETNTMPEHQYDIGRGTITLSEFGNSVPFTGKLEALSMFDVNDPTQRVLRDDMMKVIDKACGLRYKRTQRKYVCLTGTTGTWESRADAAASTFATSNLAKSGPTVFHLEEIVDWLRKSNIPPYDGEDYVGIFSVHALRTIMRDSDWTDAAKYGDPERLFAGECGRIRGVRCIRETNYLVNTLGSSSGTNNLGEGVIFGAENVIEGIAVPEELRQKIPTDYGRSKGLAWYAILGWRKCYKASDSGQDEHIVHITSTK